jgi:hypothetical protein
MTPPLPPPPPTWTSPRTLAASFWRRTLGDLWHLKTETTGLRANKRRRDDMEPRDLLPVPSKAGRAPRRSRRRRRNGIPKRKARRMSPMVIFGIAMVTLVGAAALYRMRPHRLTGSYRKGDTEMKLEVEGAP